ncbi:MAG: molybdopterin-dependent oxidoreductase [Coriobacteriales bacterium]|jgi:aldehyde oxidoreductase|nr:molybdopterin-dependent oxidoreductase [Coriobacteriales bacterium]
MTETTVLNTKTIKRRLKINGVEQTLTVDPEASLAAVLRNQLKLTGTKLGCDGLGECGACTVLWDGRAVRSCNYTMERLPNDAEIITIEGIGTADNLHPIQIAWMVHGGAQCGFCTPGFIVSAKALLDANRNPSRQEVREHFQRNRNLCRCTGYKPLVDAVITAAKLIRGEVTAEELWPQIEPGASLVGSAAIRPSALAKVTGTWDFGADDVIKTLPEDTLHIKLVQAKVSHARILSVDTREAEKVPGVFRVITAKDVPGTNRINGLAFPANLGDGKERPILCDEKIFQFGDAIAMVLSENPAIAEIAAEKVKVEIEELPAYMNALDAMAPDAIEIHPGTPNVYFTNGVVKGDEVDPLFEKLPYVVEDDFYIQRQPHLPLEPDVGYAYKEDDRLVIHSKSIALHFHALMVAEGVGIDAEKLAIVQTNAGGTFGYKFSPTMEGLLGVAALVTNRPVFLTLSQYQQITYTGKRSPWFVNLKYGADKDGKLVAMKSHWIVDHGPYCEFGDLLTMRGQQFIGAGYDIPNIRGKGETVATNHAWGSAFRGYGAPQSLFATEVLIDELAEKAGIDPLEFRYLNVYREGSKTPTGSDPDVISYPQAIDTLRPIYQKAKEAAKAANAKGGPVKRGVGVTLLEYGCGLDGADHSEAWLEITEDGMKLGVSWEDHGQGADMGALTAATEGLKPLGLDYRKIELVLNDMRVTPNSGPAGGSRSTVATGNAIRVACENMLKLLDKGDGSYRSYKEVIAEGLDPHVDGSWDAPKTATDVETGQGDPFASFMYGVLLVEVSVDTLSGKTTVDKMTIVSDCGVVANYPVLEGQLWGGLVQGIGLALSEDFEDIERQTTLRKCGIPQIADVPDEINIIHQQTPRPLGPWGMSGVGEMPISAPHAGVINAIYDACGVRVTELPAYPQKVLEALS